MLRRREVYVKAPFDNRRGRKSKCRNVLPSCGEFVSHRTTEGLEAHVLVIAPPDHIDANPTTAKTEALRYSNTTKPQTPSGEMRYETMPRP